MNLHLSFEEIQLFAGKEGNEEAHRAYPLLKQWFETVKSRKAMFHAGQIVKAALCFPPNHLRDFYAIALYHASLAFWVYGMISLGSSRSKARRQSHSFASANQYDFAAADDDLVYLDGDDTPETRRFIAIQRGIPVIHDINGGVARLDDPQAVMETVVCVMSTNCSGGTKGMPPLVENLSKLIKDLGNAGRIVRR